MASGLLSLKWNNHRSTFFHELTTIRSKEAYSDVTIACDGRFYSLHKFVLSTCSEYFKQILERTSYKNPVIVLKDIKCDELEALLNYMYIGEVNVMQDLLSGLIKAAESLKIKGLAVPDEGLLESRENCNISNSEPYPKKYKSDASPCAKKRKRENTSRHTNEIFNHDGSQLSEQNDKNQSSSSNSSNHRKENIIEDIILDDNLVKSEPIELPEEDNIIENFTNDADDCKESVRQQLCYTVTDLAGDQENTYTNNDPLSPGLHNCVQDEISTSSDTHENTESLWEEDPSVANLEEFPTKEEQDKPITLQPERQQFDEPFSSTEVIEENYNDQYYRSQRHNIATSSNILYPDFNKKQINAANFSPASSSCSSSSNMGSSYRANAFATSTAFLEAAANTCTKTAGQPTVHRCPQCQYTADRPSLLYRHMRIHTGEKPFACSMCQYKTTQQGNLNSHMARRHKVFPAKC